MSLHRGAEGPASASSTLEDRVPLEYEAWDDLYARAIAAGSGVLVAPCDERVAATDELLASAIRGLLRLGTLAAVALVAADDTRCTAVLQRQAAAVLRVLDRALAAHGRDHGYDVDAWR